MSLTRRVAAVFRAMGSVTVLVSLTAPLACAPPPLESVRVPFTSCDAAALRRDSEGVGLRFAFSACGQNHFQAPQWSTDGRQLLFGVNNAVYVLDGDRHTVRDVAAVRGDGPCAWYGREVACAHGRSLTIATANLTTTHTLGFAPTGLAAASDDTIWYWNGADVRRYDPQVGASFPALSWSPGGAPFPNVGAGIVTVQSGDDVSIRSLEDGSELQRIPRARRGRTSNDGRWSLVTSDGPTVSVYDPKPWDDLDVSPPVGGPDARVTLPVIDVVHQDGRRWRIEAFQATEADWYATPGWISVHLWGIEGRHVRANVALYDLGAQLPALESGGHVQGFRLVTPADR